MNLYIYSYNNYYNRIVKKAGDSISDYEEFLYYGPVQGVYGFTPGDGINTVQIIGSNIQIYDGKGDYLIVNNSVTGKIESRWFIISINRTRNGQWELQLRRDLIVDFYNDIIEADCFVEKATLSVDNPLIFNPENMSVNQIKTSETLLKDQSDCAWLVGYYASDATGISGTVKQNLSLDVPFVSIGYDFDDWPLRKYTNKPLAGQTTQFFYGNPTGGNYYINAFYNQDGTSTQITEPVYVKFEKSISGSDNVVRSSGQPAESNYIFFTTPATIESRLNTAFKNKMTNLNSQLSSYVDIHTEEEVNELIALNGKLIKTNDGRFFNCAIQEDKNISTGVVDLEVGSGLATSLKNIATSAGMSILNNNNKSFQVQIKRSRFRIWLVEKINYEVTYSISDTNKLITEDAPWNIFAIPYSNELVIKGVTGGDFTIDKEISINTAMSIAKQHGSKVYDIQLLPYCPVAELITDVGEITVENEMQYSIIATGQDQNVGIIFNIPKAKFHSSVTVAEDSIKLANSNIERKLNDQCDKWRLSSPNYSNYFDFSVEKNNGIEFFDIDCEYKPFTPYIHINPSFGGLYGYDDNSPRGLVCGGDFSLSRISDQWIEYEIQNKNFQATFDRQIQNMETQQDIQRKQEKWQVASGVVSGATGGAVAGQMIGGNIGAGVGALVGGAMSLAGGLTDIKYNKILRNEALDYTKDMFGYSLDNIKALPNTISKISAFNNNNKIFPVLEYYTCTDEEKKAFLNKIAFNGMSVGVIGKIKDYLTNNWSYDKIESKGYIKGKLIRLILENEDFQIVNEIAGEINKGAYF